MIKKDKDEIPGFRNYDKFLEGYHVFSDYFTDGMRYVAGKESKYHEEDESFDETEKKLIPIAKALIKGAVALQFVGDQDFYYKEKDMEILIKFRKDYKELTKEEIAWNLMKDVILILEQEEHQLERIATSYDGN